MVAGRGGGGGIPQYCSEGSDDRPRHTTVKIAMGSTLTLKKDGRVGGMCTDTLVYLNWHTF